MDATVFYTVFAGVLTYVAGQLISKLVIEPVQDTRKPIGQISHAAELQLDASLYTCLQILSVSVFEKTEISCALQPDRSQSESPIVANQLILFDF